MTQDAMAKAAREAYMRGERLAEEAAQHEDIEMPLAPTDLASLPFTVQLGDADIGANGSSSPEPLDLLGGELLDSASHRSESIIGGGAGGASTTKYVFLPNEVAQIAQSIGLVGGNMGKMRSHAEEHAPHRRLAAFPHVKGSKYATFLFPSVELPDGRAAHLYTWGEKPHAPVAPPAESADVRPISLDAIGMDLPDAPSPPAPAMSDAPGPLKPKSPTACFPLGHTLPVDPHICLGASCTLFGSLPGELLVLHAEEYEAPPRIEDMMGPAPGGRGGTMSNEQLTDSIYHPRKRWSDSKDYRDADRVVQRMFEMDWRRCLTAGMVKDPARAHVEDAELDQAEVLEVRMALYQHRTLVYNAFAYYCGVSASAVAVRAVAALECRDGGSLRGIFGATDHQRMRFEAFRRFASECIGETCTPEIVETCFVWATRDQLPQQEDSSPMRFGTAKSAPSPAEWDDGDGDDGDDGYGGDSFTRRSPRRESIESVGSRASTEDPEMLAAAAARGGSLNRYEFMQCLIKLAIARSIPHETTDVSDAVEKLLAERIKRHLPAEANLNNDVFRDDRLYTLEVEGVFRTHLRSLHALFEVYGDRGPSGSADLLSLSGWLNLLWTFDLFDDDFTPREGTLCFQASIMRVVDEIKSRSRLVALSLVDFFEALMRVAWRKKLPNPDMVKAAKRASAGEYYLQLRASPADVYTKYLQAHTQQGLLSGDPVGMRAPVAVDILISIFVTTARGGVPPPRGGDPGDLRIDEVQAYIDKAKAKQV